MKFHCCRYPLNMRNHYQFRLLSRFVKLVSRPYIKAGAVASVGGVVYAGAQPISTSEEVLTTIGGGMRFLR